MGWIASRNNVSDVRNLPADWHPGEFDRKTNQWDRTKSKNVKWVAPLGSQSYGTPVVADGRIFVRHEQHRRGIRSAIQPTFDLGCVLLLS